MVLCIGENMDLSHAAGGMWMDAAVMECRLASVRQTCIYILSSRNSNPGHIFVKLHATHQIFLAFNLPGMVRFSPPCLKISVAMRFALVNERE